MLATQKLHIRLRAFDHRIIDQAAREILHTAERTGADVSGPIPWPTKIDRVTVNRSPHVNKKSREQFEMRNHTRVLVVYPTPRTVDELMKLELASGVDVQIKLMDMD